MRRADTTHRPLPLRTHVLVGQPDQVRAALERAHLDGRLVAVHAVSELPDRQVKVTADLREHRPRRRVRVSVPARTWLLLAAGVVGAAAVVGVVWLIVAAVMALVAAVNAAIAAVAAWLATYWPALAAVAVAVLLLGSAGAAKCAGLHCGGGRRR